MRHKAKELVDELTDELVDKVLGEHRIRHQFISAVGADLHQFPNDAREIRHVLQKIRAEPPQSGWQSREIVSVEIRLDDQRDLGVVRNSRCAEVVGVDDAAGRVGHQTRQVSFLMVLTE